MTAQLSAVAKAVKPSATLSLKNEITRIETTYGVKIIDLTAGQPDIGPTPDVLAALVDGGKLHKYGPVPGEAGLRPLIAEVTNQETGSRFTADQVVVTVGAKGAIDTVMRAILDPGDAVVILAPYWVTYPEVVAICGGVSVCVECTPDLHPDLEKTAAAVKANRTKAVLYSSPSNPTGVVYTSEELAGLARIAREAGIWLIADEIYREFGFDGKKPPSIFSIPEPYDKTVLIDGPSKRFGMPGWRLGFIAGPAELAKAANALLGHTSNASRPIQHAVEVAYKSERARQATASMVSRYQKNRDIFVAGLNAIEGVKCPVPEGAFYCFADVSGLYGKTYEYDGGNKATVTDSTTFRDFLLRKAFVAAVEGGPFGMDTHLRFSLAVSEHDCTTGLGNIRKAIAELR
ncbi:MAG: aminotransferase class I/II-fold pyridoxal phosphate-dependent enzyme [Dehalococcoidia bacterium]|nr:aminotransferase class I/II-fold pyridoxal phosphate-dependent enzyme [Dehalococcoidia bacterium]